MRRSILCPTYPPGQGEFWEKFWPGCRPRSVVVSTCVSNKQVNCERVFKYLHCWFDSRNPLGEHWGDRGLLNALSTGLYGIYHASQVHD